MKHIINLRKMLSLSVLLILASMSFNSQAGHMDCVDSADGNYGYLNDKFNDGNHDGCALGHDSQDFLNPLQVNADEMFSDGTWDENDIWTFENKYDPSNGLEGEFYTPDDWDVAEVMVVFKGPNANSGTTPPFYVGYLLDLEWEGAYTWDSMFQKNNFQGVSHISFYSRGEGDVGQQCFPGPPPNCDTPIPEPQSLLILSTGLLGIFINRRKLFK